MNTLYIVLYVLAGGLAGIGLGVFLRQRFVEARKLNLEEQGRKLIEEALSEAEQIKKEALLQIKDESFQLKREAEKEIKERKTDIIEEEKKLSQ